MAATPKKMMQLNFTDICCTTDHLGLGQWKSPTSTSRFKDRLDYYVWMAQLAEKGKITSIFFADTYGTHETYGGSSDTSFSGGTGVASLDPVVMVSAMAYATKHISFAITGNTTYLKPYILARTWSTLDHMTQGRIGWHVVTGYRKSASKAMGDEDALPREVRYEAADEYMSLMYSLWEKSWEDDAQVWSVDPEIAYDPSKIHKIEFNGKYHKLSAFSQTHPSPQRTPTLFQAGASKAGIDFAGKHAEGIYCGAANIPDLLKYTKQIRAAAVAHGRDPSTIKIFCGMTPIIGKTLEEAYAKRDAAKAFADTSYVGGLAAFCGYTGVDLSKYALDEPFTFNDSSQDDASIQGIFNIFKSIERGDNEPWTPRRIGQRYAFGGLGPKAIGTPEMVADIFEEWLVGSDVDGFNIQYISNPGSFEDVVELLVPELQRRGVYWKDYPGGTFRENLQGKPGSPFTGPDHPSAKFKWNAPDMINGHMKEKSRPEGKLS